MIGRARTMALKLLALIGDAAIFYTALFVSLSLRFQEPSISRFIDHLPSFSLLLLAWIFFGYLSGIYELEVFINNRLFAFRLNRILLIQSFVMLVAFYFLPFFSIQPRIIFLIFIAVFSILIYIWRSVFNGIVASKKNAKRVVLLSSLPRTSELIRLIENNPQFGFRLEKHIENPMLEWGLDIESADIILVSGSFMKDSFFRNKLEGLGKAKTVSVLSFYRSIVRFLPIEEFVHHRELHDRKNENGPLEGIRRFVEIIASAILLVIFSPFFLLIAVAIALDSKGPVFYKQIRVGKNGENFTLYKFRSMSTDLSVNPDDLGTVPIWSSGVSDARVTHVGKFLRATHLDELAQLINIFKGDMSFIGPRPERPEFDKQLIAEIPHYEMRYLMRPGVTGWAQINYPYVSSISQAKSRLEYDLYYLFERSILLDARIMLKTLRHFFIRT